MWYGRDKAGRFLPLQKQPKQLTDKEKKLIENFEKEKKMKKDDCRWLQSEVCVCGFNEMCGDYPSEDDCEKCEDFYSIIDSENERKVNNETGELL